MSRAAASDAAPIHGGALSLRAGALGVAITAPLLAGVLGAGLLAADGRAYALLGWGVAVLTGCAGTTVIACMGTIRPDDSRSVHGYLGALVGNLLLQLFGVVGGLLALFLLGKKFAALAAFGLTFAATATVLQLTGAVLISRALRARARAVADPPTLTTHDPAPEARDPGSP